MSDIEPMNTKFIAKLSRPSVVKGELRLIVSLAKTNPDEAMDRFRVLSRVCAPKGLNASLVNGVFGEFRLGSSTGVMSEEFARDMAAIWLDECAKHPESLAKQFMPLSYSDLKRRTPHLTINKDDSFERVNLMLAFDPLSVLADPQILTGSWKAGALLPDNHAVVTGALLMAQMTLTVSNTESVTGKKVGIDSFPILVGQIEKAIKRPFHDLLNSGGEYRQRPNIITRNILKMSKHQRYGNVLADYSHSLCYVRDYRDFHQNIFDLVTSVGGVEILITDLDGTYGHTGLKATAKKIDRLIESPYFRPQDLKRFLYSPDFSKYHLDSLHEKGALKSFIKVIGKNWELGLIDEGILTHAECLSSEGRIALVESSFNI